MLRSIHFSFYFQILSLKFVKIPATTRGVSIIIQNYIRAPHQEVLSTLARHVIIHYVFS
jgi:hypothetical protein